jgi:hypothetical protein
MAARYSAVDAVLLIVLAARIHKTDAAVRAVARNIVKQLPVADRPGVRKIMTSKYPLRVAELLLDCWALVHGEEPSKPPDKGATP